MGSKLNHPIRQILMLCNDRKIDRRISLEADSLEEAGWKVTILAIPLDECVIDEDPRIRRIGSKERTLCRESLVLSGYRLVRKYFAMNSYLMRKLKSFTWQFIVDYERFYLNLFLEEGRQYISDVVVAHDLPMLAVGRILAAEFKAQLVYDSHELYCEQEFSRKQRLSWLKVEQRHIHSCHQVITVNPSIARELEKRYQLAHVNVIYNAERVFPLGARSSYLHTRFAIAHEHRVLLFQGGLSIGRNLVELVKAMALLKTIPVHLVFLGDGVLVNSLQRLILLLGLTERVHFHPAVSQSNLLAITASADAGIIPYQPICLNNYYCTPNKLFEFIAAGIPILASNLPELKQLVVGNDIGQTFDLNSPENIANAITNFFSDEQRIYKWRNNLQAVREQVNWQNEGEKLKKIYEGLK